MGGDKATTRSQKESDQFVSLVVENVLKSKEIQLMLKKCIEEALDVKFAELKEEIEKIAGTIHEIECKLQEHSKEIAECKRLQNESTERNTGFAKQLNNLEQYSRRNCVRITGIGESEREDTEKIVMDIADKRLGISLSLSDIDRSHRIGQASNTTSSRPIIVKFTSYRARAKFIGARRKLKGSKIVITEDLTRSNQQLLQKTRDHSAVKTAWSHDGNIIALISRNGKEFRKRIVGENDLTTI